jgi:hypothetical protein
MLLEKTSGLKEQLGGLVDAIEDEEQRYARKD